MPASFSLGLPSHCAWQAEVAEGQAARLEGTPSTWALGAEALGLVPWEEFREAFSVILTEGPWPQVGGGHWRGGMGEGKEGPPAGRCPDSEHLPLSAAV